MKTMYAYWAIRDLRRKYLSLRAGLCVEDNISKIKFMRTIMLGNCNVSCFLGTWKGMWE